MRVNLRITAPGGESPDGLRRPVPVDALRALRTFLERVDVTETVADVPAPGDGPRGIGETAAALTGWEDALRFVRDTISYVPYAGSVRGAAGALETRGANSLDQALLLRTLLRAHGVAARLVRGRLDWESARRLVLGGAEPGAPGEGDPWPRWVEIAADHWWVEVEDDEIGVLDPTFVGVGPDGTPGHDGRPVAELPDELQGRLQVTLVRGDVILAEAELTTAEAAGSLLELELVPSRSAGAPVAGGAAPDSTGVGSARRTRRGDATAAGAASAATPGSGADGGWNEPLVVPGRWTSPRGPWTVRLLLPGRTLEAGPVEGGELPNLVLRLRVSVPHGPVQRLDVPWGASPSGRLAVVVAGGRVTTGRLAEAARPLYRALRELGRAEVGARDALRPPRRYGEGIEGLRKAAEDVWETFGRAGPPALGWALLRALDDLDAGSSAARVLRPGLRVLAVRWRPPDPSATPYLAVTLDDPVIIGQVEAGLSVAELQSAYGLLQSAVLSQALHELVGEPPLTAFDVTLRAVGTGVGVGWFRSLEELPAEWPDTIRAVAADDLAAGHLLIGPLRPPRDPAVGLGMGWWQVGLREGRTRGKVVGPAGPRHGWVEMATPGWTDLDGLLGSLPSLHRGLRWLATMPGAEGSRLRGIARSACASAALVGSTLGQGAPVEWPTPAVDAYCGSRRGR